jgi:hypothetical protein
MPLTSKKKGAAWEQLMEELKGVVDPYLWRLFEAM